MSAPVLEEEYGVRVNLFDTEGDVIGETIIVIGPRETCERHIDVTPTGRGPVLIRREVTPWEPVT